MQVLKGSMRNLHCIFMFPCKKKYNEDFSEEDSIDKMHIRELLYSFGIEILQKNL